MSAAIHRLTLALACVAATALPAAASSLPHVDFGPAPTFGVGLGSNQAWQPGGSVSVDMPIGPNMLIGGAVASTFTGGLNFDLRGLYRFVEGGTEGPTIAAIAGLWGQPGLNRFQGPIPVAPLVGFGLAYPVTDRIDARLNLTYSPFYSYGQETLAFLGGPPGSGVEVGYQISPGIEATLGINGRGDFLGVNVAF